MQLINQVFSVALLVFGFGFVIFWHELGHFLAAKWVGIKVEQFAVGFGQALFSWRKGLGLRFGSSTKEFEEKVRAHGNVMHKWQLDKELTSEQFNQASAELGISETEYRLNWIPLGGYVKMLGQDDMKPGEGANDPQAYNRQSIPARMLVVCAGVIMNIILAGIGFMVVFMMGFNAPPPVVGGIVPGSPAQKAGVEVGDRIVAIEGRPQHDFTKIALNTALIGEGDTVPMVLRKRDGSEKTVQIMPLRPDGDPKAFLAMGIIQPTELRGIKAGEFVIDESAKNLVPAETFGVRPGDTIVAVNGKSVGVKDYATFDAALQDGKPVNITVKTAEGETRQVEVQPRFQRLFGKESINFAGMQPRPMVDQVTEASPARGKLLPGDAIVKVEWGSNEKTNPSTNDVMKIFNEAGQAGKEVKMTVLRDGKTVAVDPVVPSLKVAEGRRGMGIALGYDAEHPVVADVDAGSAAAEAGVHAGAVVTSINGQAVSSWHDVVRILKETSAGTMKLGFKTDSGEEKTADLALTAAARDQVASYRYTHSLALHDRNEPRKASGPVEAMAWGVTETRDFVLQFYLTLKRMVQGSVSYTNMMGPVGIFHAGTKFAFKGMDWLIWFLSMISANLAVVNFLPIPIVDGGLFTFLIIEKIMGKPLSPKAQQIAQFVGLAMILGVFLLVTYQDISRLL